MLRRSFREVCPNFHAYRVRFGEINFYLVDLVDDVARFAYYRDYGMPYFRRSLGKLNDFFEFADMFFEEESE